MKVRAKVSFVGARLGMMQGQEGDVPDALAKEFIKSGHIEAVEEKKSTKAGAAKGKSAK